MLPSCSYGPCCQPSFTASLWWRGRAFVVSPYPRCRNTVLVGPIINYLVGKEGLEPSRPSGQQILSLQRMPFRHLPIMHVFANSTNFHGQSLTQFPIRTIRTIDVQLLSSLCRLSEHDNRVDVIFRLDYATSLLFRLIDYILKVNPFNIEFFFRWFVIFTMTQFMIGKFFKMFPASASINAAINAFSRVKVNTFTSLFILLFQIFLLCHSIFLWYPSKDSNLH